MQKMSVVDGPYSAACNSQPLTFIESDFAGAENTQATEFNYELTFPTDAANAFAHTQQQQLASQLEQPEASQLTSGPDDDPVGHVVRDLNTLNFEEDEEEMYNVIDLPDHACA
jgi:hypothetical protein